MALADYGPEKAMHEDDALLRGLNTYQGEIAHPVVAESQGRDWHSVEL